ncbi:hypothetical protein GWK47_034175 [Chionoecetes opilio]|uniref:Uncharacterized protein n=1 Tax=Chionoecetes opilio TaxID=41210 RepID=A0A8J4YJ60_CHIOP|nr:hypothetical protein GWK47_034175 [Chionoecetes opilio]
MLLLDAVYFSHRENHSTLQLLANLFHELDHGAIFWLLLSGGHCPQLVDDMNAPAALWYITSAARTSRSGGSGFFQTQNSFQLWTASMIRLALQSSLTRCRTSFGFLHHRRRSIPSGNRSRWRGGGTRGGGGPPVGLYEFASKPTWPAYSNILLGGPTGEGPHPLVDQRWSSPLARRAAFGLKPLDRDVSARHLASGSCCVLPVTLPGLSLIECLTGDIQGREGWLDGAWLESSVPEQSGGGEESGVSGILEENNLPSDSPPNTPLPEPLDSRRWPGGGAPLARRSDGPGVHRPVKTTCPR